MPREPGRCAGGESVGLRALTDANRRGGYSALLATGAINRWCDSITSAHRRCYSTDHLKTPAAVTPMRDNEELKPGIDKPTHRQYWIGAFVIAVFALATYCWRASQ